ncbi:FtsH protease activity modulator HflK [bacterium]|nr:FtsH protease activity modulator HflK [candidate division CSSED10-310 bacterium]
MQLEHRGMNVELRKGWIMAIVLVGMFLILIVKSYFIVDQAEVGIVLRFGKFSRKVDPGLHFKVPLIEKNYNVKVQENVKVEFGYRTLSSTGRSRYDTSRDFSNESRMLTGDLNIVDVEWIIQYGREDPKAWLFNVDEREKTIRDIAQSIINELVGDRTVFDVMGSERGPMEIAAADLMNELFTKYKLGITVSTVKLQNIEPPEGKVQDAFEDVNKAIQDRNRLINEGKEFYNKAVYEAEGTARRVVEEAEGYATERKNMARGDAARFISVLKEYRAAPEVTRQRLYFEMMQEVFSGGKGGDLIDKSLSNFMPLKMLGEQTLKGGGK